MPARKTAASALRAGIRRLARSQQFRQRVTDLLVELCRIDTTPSPDVARMRDAEARTFDILERELARLNFPAARAERRPIDPLIATHPDFTPLHYTRTPQRPAGLTPDEAYAGRSNLLYLVHGTGRGDGEALAVNAHVDVVAPYFPPRVKDGVVFGRGSADDKGSVAAILGALQILSEVMPAAGLSWKHNLLVMLVIDEEPGGNGSLSLALDCELKQLYDSMIVGEITSLKLHPANRGAVWYRAELVLPGVSLLEMAAFVNEEIEKEGAALRAESRHELFPQRPVQTCHGIIGPYGEHPSRICGAVSFAARFERPIDRACERLVRDCLDSALAEYTGIYGDKTRCTDPSTGKPVVARHCTVRRRGRDLLVEVQGAAGHMGAVRERDGAITKMSHMVRALVRSRPKIEALAHGPMRLQLVKPHGATLVLEGGQGFVPTHDIREVTRRLEAAAERGAENYLRGIGRRERGEAAVRVTYEKLHNAAFEGPRDSPTMRRAIAAARQCGIWRGEPILGWTVSCDARLFAAQYPGMDVVTFGPGLLAHAHSDEEQISVRELCRAAEFFALFFLRQTGSHL